MHADKLAAARARRAKGESPTQIATALGVSRASVYRHLAAAEQPPPEGGGDEQAPCSVGGVRDNQPVLNLRNRPSVNSPRKPPASGPTRPRIRGSRRSVLTSSVGWPAAPGTRHHRGPCPGELKPVSSRSMTVCTRHSVARACRYVLARTVLHAKVEVGAQQAEDFHTAGVVPPVGRMACQMIARWWRCRRGGCGIFATMTWIRRLRCGIRAGRARNPLRCSRSRR